jgi:esterase/lipase
MESLAWRLEKCLTLNVYQFTLPGHAYKENCTYHDWVKSVDEKVEMLIKDGYSEIYVVGHSMGGVLAAYAASKYPEIKKVVLAAPAFKYIGEKDNFSIQKAKSIVDEYGLAEILFRGFERLPISAVNEFMTLVSKYQEPPKKIKVPILIFQGLKDDIVPKESSEYVFDNVQSKTKSLVYLQKSNHDIFNGPQKGVVNIKIEKFLLFDKIKGEKETI